VLERGDEGLGLAVGESDGGFRRHGGGEVDEVGE
jgi:hypothetical protein